MNITESLDIGVMDVSKADFYVTAGSFTGLKYNDKDYKHITLRRALPVSRPHDYISVADSENKEIGIIRTVDELSDAQKIIVLNELENRYYCPEIIEVTSVKDKLGYVYMELRLKNKSGKIYQKSCAIKDVSRNIRMLSDTSVIVFDVDGNRYLISSVSDLDKNSLKRLDPYLF